MTSAKDDTPAAPSNPPFPEPPSRRKLVRFDLPPGASLDEIVRAVHEMTQGHLKPPARYRAGQAEDADRDEAGKLPKLPG